MPTTVGDSVSAGGFIVLSREAMQEVGPAAQTLGAFYFLAKDRLAYNRMELIANCAGVGLRTAIRHKKRLLRDGWIVSHGRQSRRTVSYELSDKALKKQRPYERLPTWAFDLGTWSDRFVMACLVSAAQHIVGGRAAQPRRFLSTATIRANTGLTAPSVRKALAMLRVAGLIESDPKGRISINPFALIPAQKVSFGGAKSVIPPAQKVSFGGAKSVTRSEEALLQAPHLQTRSEARLAARSDHRLLFVDNDMDANLAQQAFRAMQYTGDDGEIVWKAACWVRACEISESQFASAYQGVKLCSTKNPIGYFVQCLRETMGTARYTALARKTRRPRQSNAAPPKAVAAGAREGEEKKRTNGTKPASTTPTARRLPIDPAELASTYTLAPRPTLDGAALEARKATLQNQLALAKRNGGTP